MDQKPRRGALRLASRFIAAVLIVFVSCAMIFGCIVSALIAVDIARNRGKDYLNALADWSVGRVKKLLAPQHKKRTAKTLENKGFMPFYSCFCRLFVA